MSGRTKLGIVSQMGGKRPTPDTVSLFERPVIPQGSTQSLQDKLQHIPSSKPEGNVLKPEGKVPVTSIDGDFEKQLMLIEKALPQLGNMALANAVGKYMSEHILIADADDSRIPVPVENLQVMFYEMFTYVNTTPQTLEDAREINQTLIFLIENNLRSEHVEDNGEFLKKILVKKQEEIPSNGRGQIGRGGPDDAGPGSRGGTGGGSIRIPHGRVATVLTLLMLLFSNAVLGVSLEPSSIPETEPLYVEIPAMSGVVGELPSPTAMSGAGLVATNPATSSVYGFLASADVQERVRGVIEKKQDAKTAINELKVFLGEIGKGLTSAQTKTEETVKPILDKVIASFSPSKKIIKGMFFDSEKGIPSSFDSPVLSEAFPKYAKSLGELKSIFTQKIPNSLAKFTKLKETISTLRTSLRNNLDIIEKVEEIKDDINTLTKNIFEFMQETGLAEDLLVTKDAEYDKTLTAYQSRIRSKDKDNDTLVRLSFTDELLRTLNTKLRKVNNLVNICRQKAETTLAFSRTGLHKPEESTPDEIREVEDTMTEQLLPLMESVANCREAHNLELLNIEVGEAAMSRGLTGNLQISASFTSGIQAEIGDVITGVIATMTEIRNFIQSGLLDNDTIGSLLQRITPPTDSASPPTDSAPPRGTVFSRWEMGDIEIVDQDDIRTTLEISTNTNIQRLQDDFIRSIRQFLQELVSSRENQDVPQRLNRFVEHIEEFMGPEYVNLHDAIMRDLNTNYLSVTNGEARAFLQAALQLPPESVFNLFPTSDLPVITHPTVEALEDAWTNHVVNSLNNYDISVLLSIRSTSSYFGRWQTHIRSNLMTVGGAVGYLGREVGAALSSVIGSVMPYVAVVGGAVATVGAVGIGTYAYMTSPFGALCSFMGCSRAARVTAGGEEKKKKKKRQTPAPAQLPPSSSSSAESTAIISPGSSSSSAGSNAIISQGSSSPEQMRMREAMRRLQFAFLLASTQFPYEARDGTPPDTRVSTFDPVYRQPLQERRQRELLQLVPGAMGPATGGTDDDEEGDTEETDDDEEGDADESQSGRKRLTRNRRQHKKRHTKKNQKTRYTRKQKAYRRKHITKKRHH